MKKITKTILITGLMAAIAGGSIFAKTTVSIKSTFLDDLAEAITESAKVSIFLESDDEDELKKKNGKKPLDAGTKKPCKPDAKAEVPAKNDKKAPADKKAEPQKKEPVTGKNAPEAKNPASNPKRKYPNEFDWDWEKDDPYRDWPEDDLKEPPEPKNTKKTKKSDSGKSTTTTTTVTTTKTTTTTTNK